MNIAIIHFIGDEIQKKNDLNKSPMCSKVEIGVIRNGVFMEAYVYPNNKQYVDYDSFIIKDNPTLKKDDILVIDYVTRFGFTNRYKYYVCEDESESGFCYKRL